MNGFSLYIHLKSHLKSIVENNKWGHFDWKARAIHQYYWSVNSRSTLCWLSCLLPSKHQPQISDMSPKHSIFITKREKVLIYYDFHTQTSANHPQECGGGDVWSDMIDCNQTTHQLSIGFFIWGMFPHSDKSMRVSSCPLQTSDNKYLQYSHLKKTTLF